MIKKTIKIIVTEALSLYLITQVVEGVYFKGGVETFFWAVFALSMATYLVKPIINLLILPLNLITFGFFRWVSSVLALYLVTLTVKDFMIERFFFPGLSTYWIDIPQLNFQGFFAILAYSLSLSIITSFLRWVFK